jgi:ketosteroid isomerase-like protein
MGYTFGPWEFKQDIHDQKAVAFGHFATIWKRQVDGSWKFAVDLGISHPVSAIPTTPWAPKATARKSAKHRIAPAALNLARAGLRARDLEFSQTSAREGSLKAFTAYTADDIRIFRNEHLPFAGKSALEVALSEVKGVLTWQPEGVDVSRSGDLGYTYGRYEIKENGALTGKGNYMRFWKKQNDAWKVVLDVADPLPLEEKKG